MKTIHRYNSPIVRARKFDAPPIHPRVPHKHVCRKDRGRRHPYECREAKCDWTLFRDCGGCA